MKHPIMTLFKIATALGALAIAGSAQAAPEFKLRWGHYLPNTPFVQVEKDLYSPTCLLACFDCNCLMRCGR